ncbi:MAG TPA: SIS domain-containing protein [Abditibacteriaceae bacterium]
MNPILTELAQRHVTLAPLCPQIDEVATQVCDSQRAGGTLFLCGNGGSACDADHIAAELLKSFGVQRPLVAEEIACFAGLPDAQLLTNRLERGARAVSLHHPASLLTAVANDIDASLCFAQSLWALARRGDVLLAITTSGNSQNVLLAAQTARAIGLCVVGLTGEKECKLDALCDLKLKVPERETFKVQELHLPLYHALCLLIEQRLFGEGIIEPDNLPKALAP